LERIFVLCGCRFGNKETDKAREYQKAVFNFHGDCRAGSKVNNSGLKLPVDDLPYNNILMF